jgi:[ribosomal protein S5]-alanine N-acetyltransferase
VNVIRPVTLDDAPALAALLRANRAFLAPWDPIRPEEYFTDEGQRDDVRSALQRAADDAGLVQVILDDSGAVAGRIALNSIVRGPFQSCSLGYWVAQAAGGRGLATAAVREIKRVAFEQLGLHRIQADTLRHNAASRRVLERNGFVRIGMAPTYLRIAGHWQDMDLFQAINPDWSE